MQVFIHQYKALWRNIVRSKLYVLSFIALLVYTASVFWPHLENQDPMGMVQYTQYAQMTAMLFFLFLGVRLEWLERDNQCEEIVSCAAVSRFSVVLPKIALLFSIAFAFFAGVYGILCVFYGVMGTAGEIYLYGARMFALYFLLSDTICGLLGLLVGAVSGSRAAWVCVLALWLFVSPISAEATSFIFQMMGTTSSFLMFLFSLLNLGGKVALQIIPVYGITFEPGVLYKNLLILLLCFLVLWLVCRTGKLVLRRLICLGGVALLVLTAAFLFPTMGLFYTYYGVPNTTALLYELNYYSDRYDKENTLRPDAIPAFDTGEHLRPLSHEIQLTVGVTGIAARDTLTCEVVEASPVQTFTLYRHLLVSEVTCEGDPLTFRQESDYLEVDLPEAAVGQRLTLTISYRGTSSPQFPASRGGVYLPAPYPWYPEPLYKEPPSFCGYNHMEQNVLFEPVVWDEPVSYSLETNLRGTMYTNLDNTAPGVFAGTSRDGLTLFFHPLLRQKEIDGDMFYYPASAELGIGSIIKDTQTRASELPDDDRYFPDSDGAWIDTIAENIQREVRAQNEFFAFMGEETSDPEAHVIVPEDIGWNSGLVYALHGDNFARYSSTVLMEMDVSSALAWGLGRQRMYAAESAVGGLFVKPHMSTNLYKSPVNNLIKVSFEVWWTRENGWENVDWNYQHITGPLIGAEGKYGEPEYTDEASVEAVLELAELLDQCLKEEPERLEAFYFEWYQAVREGEVIQPVQALEWLKEAVK